MISASIDLVSLIEQQSGIRLIRKASTGGGEYAGSCPWCGGQDRFLVWPQSTRPHYHCRQCYASGDLIQFLRDYAHMSYIEACQELDIEPEHDGWNGAKSELQSQDAPPPKKWREVAALFVQRAERYLWHPKSPEGQHALVYLRGRGLTDETIKAAHLGYVPLGKDGRWYNDEFEAWGLDPADLSPDQLKKGKLRVPNGIIIPWFVGGEVWKLAIKRPGEKMDYGQVMGSVECLYNVDAIQYDTPVMIVEGEFDALSVLQVAGDLVACVATGSTTRARQGRWIAEMMMSSYRIQAYDDDPAGEQGAEYWLKALPDCFRFQPIYGKDPNEMLQELSGEELRNWVLWAIYAWENAQRLESLPEAAPTTLARENSPQDNPTFPQDIHISGKIIPFGYSVKDAEQQISQLMQDEQMLLVDIRYSSSSIKKPEWSKDSLQSKYGDRYVWVRELGNKNYYTHGPIEIANLDAGLTRIITELQKGYSLILLCTCPNYNTCHRKVVVDALLKRLPDVEVIQPSSIETPEKRIERLEQNSHISVVDAGELLNFLADYTAQLQSGDRVALDLETTGLDRYKAKIVTVQLGLPGQAHILDVRAYYSLSSAEQQVWQTAFQRLFSVSGVTWLGHNLKFDWLFLAQHFGVKPGVTYDTMIAEQCQHNGRSVGESMKETAARYGLSVSKDEQTSTVDLDKTSDWDKPFRDEQIAYMVQDVVVPHQFYAAQQPLLAQNDLQRVVALENAALQAVVAMEARGALIDLAQLDRIATSKRKRQADLERKLREVLEPAYQRAVRRNETSVQDSFWKDELPQVRNFKLSSSEQLRSALTEIGVVVKDTKAETLEEAVGQHECIGDLLEWKKLQTSLNTFCSKLPIHIRPDGRVHTNFKTVASGRYVTSTPNLQAMPKARDGESAEEDPRRCIVAAPGYKLLAADLSNIELRILAEVSKDATMLRLFAEGKDLHAETAKLMFNLPPETDTKKHLVHGKNARSVAKTINFGIAYGMGAGGLSRRTGVDLDAAKELMTRYIATYPTVTTYVKRSGRESMRRGYAVSLSGRRRYFPIGDSSCEGSAKNHPIQGTNADILKRALILLYERLPEDVSIVLTIHDEIVLECPEAKIEEATSILQECMLGACRAFLTTVTIPTPDVLVADYWKKD